MNLYQNDQSQNLTFYSPFLQRMFLVHDIARENHVRVYLIHDLIDEPRAGFNGAAKFGGSFVGCQVRQGGDKLARHDMTAMKALFRLFFILGVSNALQQGLRGAMKRIVHTTFRGPVEIVHVEDVANGTPHEMLRQRPLYPNRRVLGRVATSVVCKEER